MDLLLEALGRSDDPGMIPMHVVKLLLWVGRKRPDGNLGRLTVGAVARYSGWAGDAQVFFDALVAASWLVEAAEGWRVEGWERHGGQVLKRREQWRTRKQNQRGKGRHGDVPRDTSGSHAGVTPLNLKGEGEDLARDSEPAGLAELVAAANLRLGTLGGTAQVELRNLCPILPHEIEGALATRARSWRYVAKAIVGMRVDAAEVTAPAGAPRKQQRAGWSEPSGDFAGGDVKL